MSRKRWFPAGGTEDEIAEAVREWLKAMELDFDTRVYTRTEWRKRGEKYGNRAIITIATEGPLYDLVNNYVGGAAGREFWGQWERFLADLGLWHELGYAWSIHLYKK